MITLKKLTGDFFTVQKCLEVTRAFAGGKSKYRNGFQLFLSLIFIYPSVSARACATRSISLPVILRRHALAPGKPL